MYIVMSVHKELEIDVLGDRHQLPIEDFAEGCCGFLLVFNTREDAEKFAHSPDHILKVKRVNHD